MNDAVLLKQKLLEMAKVFHKFCQENDIKYYMLGGTMLGAIRHKGFIPWDDDIDFIMMRKDYDKLVKIASEEFKGPYFFQCTYTDDGYYCGHGQIRNVETAAIGRSELGKKYCRGIDIDIFVLDGFIENPLLRFLHRTSTMFIKKTIRAYLSRIDENRSFGKKALAVFSKGLYSVVPYRKAFALYEIFSFFSSTLFLYKSIYLLTRCRRLLPCDLVGLRRSSTDML